MNTVFRNSENGQDSLQQKQSLKLTTRGYHAVMALVELASHNQGEQREKPVPLAEIAEARKISLSYLEQLFAGLRRHGLVKSARGPGGGYRLGKDPSDITIAAIFTAAEDSVPGKRVLSRSANDTTEDAAGVHHSTQYLWDHIGQVLYRDLSHRTLNDVLRHDLSFQDT